MTRLFIDTDSEVWYSRLKQLDVKVIKMPYILDGKEFYDDSGEGADYANFYDSMRKGCSAKTAALNNYDYIEYFEPHFAAGEEILYVAFSSQLSGTFQQMHMAVDELKVKYPKASFTYFDTKSISMGAGTICLHAAKLVKEGKNAKQIVKELEEFSRHVAVWFVVDDLVYLKRGGRISGATAFVGGLLGVKPVLKVTDEGKIEKVDTIKGSRNVCRYLTDLCVNNYVKGSGVEMTILHGDNLSAAEMLQQSLKENLPEAQTNIQLVGPVIGSHCGPGILGIVFYSKQR